MDGLHFYVNDFIMCGIIFTLAAIYATMLRVNSELILISISYDDVNIEHTS